MAIRDLQLDRIRFERTIMFMLDSDGFNISDFGCKTSKSPGVGRIQDVERSVQKSQSAVPGANASSRREVF